MNSFRALDKKGRRVIGAAMGCYLVTLITMIALSL